MRTRAAALPVFCLAFGLVAATRADAQYGAHRPTNLATGENYRVELGYSFWNPTPDIVITSEELGIPGSAIDFVQDLGIENSTFRQLKVVLRPGLKHKFRFEYIPIKYTTEDTVLTRNIVFNGISYPISLRVDSELKWKAYRFGYEWDFVYKDRGFVGLLLEAKYTDVEATLINVLDTEFVRARAPIPAIGVIGRGYLAANVSITSEFTFFKLPDVDDEYGGKYYDFDLYGTLNFNDHAGVQGGFRSFTVNYKVEQDEGDMVLKGLYFGGVVRF